MRTISPANRPCGSSASAPPPLSADLIDRLLVQVSQCLDWMTERAEHYDTFYEDCICEQDSVFWWHDRNCGQQKQMEIRALASDVRRLVR